MNPCRGVPEPCPSPLLTVDPKAPKLARVDCDDQRVLCAALASPPTVWYVQFPPVPAAGALQSRPKTAIYHQHLNTTTTTTEDILALHSKKLYEKGVLIDNAWHPFDGFLAQNNLLMPVTYFLFAFSLIPGWSVAIIISFATRSLM